MNIFKNQIKIIKKSNYVFSNPSKFNKKFHTPKKNKEILLTIDDGFESFYLEAWPYLKKKKSHLFYLYQLNLLEKEDI